MKTKDDYDNLLPYRDRQLRDRPDEIWLPVPSYEEYLLISNQGRVKKNVQDKNGNFTKKEMIVLPAINSMYNNYLNETTNTLQCGCMIEGKRIYFQIHRMVYYCFVEKFDLNDRYLLIGISGNRLEITTDKLFMMNQREKTHFMYEQGRQHSLISEDPQALINLNIGKPNQLNCVSQYNADGKLLKTFENITVASDQTKVPIRWIRYSAKWLVCLSRGFYWRYGAEATLNVTLIKKIMAMKEINTILEAHQYYKKIESGI